MKNIFIAFIGPKIKQRDKFFKIANNDSYECWNLSKLSFDDFIKAIQKKIPPPNKRILKNYKTQPFSINQEYYQKCSWGLLLPDRVPNAIIAGYSEIMLLINLYSFRFLYPAFYVANIGIIKIDHSEDLLSYHHYQDQYKIFRNKKFITFLETLFPQSVYGSWQRDRCANWNKEDWRLFVASLLFSELKKYENSKDSITWQRESADITTILECLFTAEDSISEGIGYKLRKRVGVLLGFTFENIEEEIRELYKQRSKFIHGSFFNEIGKESKNPKSVTGLPLPNFGLLYKKKEYLRFLLISYLNLDRIHKQDKGEFNEEKVIEILEKAILDIELRKKIIKHTKNILYLLPKEQLNKWI